MRSWIDENTGRRVRQLTDFPGSASMGYFRKPKHLPDGFLLVGSSNPYFGNVSINPASGELRSLRIPSGHGVIRIDHAAGKLWHVGVDREKYPDARKWFRVNDAMPALNICEYDFAAGTSTTIGSTPEGAPSYPISISADLTHIVMAKYQQNLRHAPTPDDLDLLAFWRFFDRPRSGELFTCHIQTQQIESIFQSEGYMPIHIEFSPTDANLIRYAQDTYDAFEQRVWMMNRDGSDRRPIRPQQFGELVTHEFWWRDGQCVAFKYQDRRGDPTLRTLPWAEYSPIPTQFGLADTTGREIYLSDPINHYHTHIYVSPDGRKLCGEGTDGHSFVYAANFDRSSTTVDFKPLATIHTKYQPFSAGQKVGAGFSQDGRWVVYNDKVDGRFQICAVEADV